MLVMHWCTSTEDVETRTFIDWCISTKGVETRNFIGWRTSAKGVESRNFKYGSRNAPIFTRRKKVKFENKKIQFIYINNDYLKYLSAFEPELQFDENGNYEEKPHIGLLINNDGRKYVIPLTSAKEKHKKWSDVSATYFRLYEIIDLRTDTIRNDDIIVEIKNLDILRNIESEDTPYIKQKILSVLDIRKMFPVIEGVYSPVNIEISSSKSKIDNNKHHLLFKEYLFLLKIATDIEEKTEKTYIKQISTGKILKYHCNYKKLEEASDNYKINEK